MLKGDTSPAEVFEEPYPCDGCPHFSRCAEEELSCKAFYVYVTEKGRIDPDPRSYNPNLGWYYRTFVRRSKADATYERILVLEQGLVDGAYVRGSGINELGLD